MTSKAAVEDFLGQKVLAVAGASRDPKKFGNTVYKDLKAKGYRVYPINPNVDTIEGDACYPNLSALPEPVGGVVVVLPPTQTEKVVAEAAAAGIQRIWMQQGAESPAAIRLCEEKGIREVHGECILMYAAPSFPHTLHGFVWKLMGKAPR